MESLKNKFPYSMYRRYFFRFQLAASVVLCFPVFLSIIFLIGIPHLVFFCVNSFLYTSKASWGKRFLHGLMFLYYTGLLVYSLSIFSEMGGIWEHADSIDNLIQIQMLMLPGFLFLQLFFIAAEWFYPVLLPHEILDKNTERHGHIIQQSKTPEHQKINLY